LFYFAFADGHKDEAERAELKRIADALAGEGSINLAPLYQAVLLKRVSMASAVAALKTSEARQLAFEMAVCVCDADGVQSAAEQAFLADLQSALAIDLQQSAAYSRQAETIAALPLGAGASGSTPLPPPAPAPLGAVEHASTLSEAEMDKMILNAAILNGALELLPESLSTMAIIPLQMKLVYRIGKSYGFELDRTHIKDFLATLGVGLTSQYLEQAGRKLLGGLDHELTAVVNVGDDAWMHGVRICPDLDTCMYTLGGGIDPFIDAWLKSQQPNKEKS